MTENNNSRDEQIQIANTIINQMGGSGKLKAMVGAKDFLALDSGVQFKFKLNPKMNKVVIKYNDLDLYDVEFFKQANITGNEKTIEAIDKKVANGRIVVESFEGIYYDMLKPVFEETTGLRLSL